MNSLGNDRALYVAERLIDFCHERERQENLRHYWYIQQKKELKHCKRSVIVLTVILTLMLFLCVRMISLEMQVREREERVSLLMTEVSELKKLNTEAEKRLTNTADYQWVQEEARKLGMSHADADQVIYYSIENEDYMVQLEDIPAG